MRERGVGAYQRLGRQDALEDELLILSGNLCAVDHDQVFIVALFRGVGPVEAAGGDRLAVEDSYLVVHQRFLLDRQTYVDPGVTQLLNERLLRRIVRALTLRGVGYDRHHDAAFTGDDHRIDDGRFGQCEDGHVRRLPCGIEELDDGVGAVE